MFNFMLNQFLKEDDSSPPAGLLLHLRPSNDTDIIPAGITAPSYTTNSTTKITGTSSIDISESPTSATHFLVPEFNNFGTNTTFTFSLWIYKTGSVPGTNYAGLIAHEQHRVTNYDSHNDVPSAGAWGDSWSFSYSDTELIFWRTNAWWSTRVNFALPNDTWTFLSFSMNGYDITIYYVDQTGTMNTHTATMTSTNRVFENGGFWVGKFGDNNGGTWVDEADSYMDSIRYYNTVLTQAEVQAIYDAEIPTTTPFVPPAGHRIDLITSKGGTWITFLKYFLFQGTSNNQHIYDMYDGVTDAAYGSDYRFAYDINSSTWVDVGSNYPSVFTITGNEVHLSSPTTYPDLGTFIDPFYVPKTLPNGFNLYTPTSYFVDTTGYWHDATYDMSYQRNSSADSGTLEAWDLWDIVNNSFWSGTLADRRIFFDTSNGFWSKTTASHPENVSQSGNIVTLDSSSNSAFNPYLMKFYDPYVYTPPPTYKYLGFYTTSISTQNPALYEMIINYTGGSITYASTEELGATNTAVDNSLQGGYGMAFHSSYDPPEVHKLFDSNVVDTIIYMTANGVDKFYFYLELDTPIPDITAFKYWTYGNNSYSFNDLSIYGTNTDPATMGTNGSNMNTLAGNWTLLSSPSTTTKAYYNASYNPGGIL